MRRFERLLQDLRFSLRSFRRSPGFFGIAVVVLALGIGMSTAIVTVLNAVVLRDLPVASPEELVVLYAEDRTRGFDHLPLRHSMFEEFARSSDALQAVAGFQYAGAWPRTFRDGERTVRAPGALVTGDFFGALAAVPAVGRTLRHEDYDSGSEPSMVISDAMWASEFGRDQATVGRRLRLVSHDIPFTIVGVMAPDFNVPGGADYWIPLPLLYPADGEALSQVGVDLVGRLAPGGTAAAARIELDSYLAAQSISPAYARVDAVGRSLMEREIGEVRPALLIVSAAAGLLLLVACFNTATLFLMRTVRRGAELRLRSALGASRGRIVAQLLTESAAVAVLGGVAGLLLVAPILAVFLAIAPESLPRLDAVRVDASTFAIGVGITALVALLAGGLPALGVARGRAGALRSGAIRSTAGLRGSLARRVLVATQFGLALAVLAAAGLVVRSLVRLQALDPGFATDGLVMVELSGPSESFGPPEPTRLFFDRLLPVLEARPGIEGAAAVVSWPFSGSGGFDARFVVDDQTPEEAESNPWLNLELVSAGYFDAFDMPIRAGRPLTADDGEGAAPSVVVNESAAAVLWPGQDPIGRRIRSAGEGTEWFTVVGVAGDTRYREYRVPRPSIYFSAAAAPYPIHPSRLAVRASAGEAAAVSTVRQVVAEQAPDVIVAVVAPMEELLEAPLAQPRLNVLLLTAFAATALVLAAVGLYGVLAFAVRQRRRELGIRQALGATSRDIARVVLREGMIIALAGTAVGLVASLAFGRAMNAVLYEVSPADPVTLALISLLLGGVALFACWVPARHAARTDPNELLRSE